MIKTTFLAATNGQAMVKNLITGDSYPNVTNVNSFEHAIEDLPALFEVLKLHADQGHCFLKGELDRPLKNESRAGHTESKNTKIVILDIDSDNLPFQSRDLMLKALGLPDIDYIFQHSSKATNEDALRGHYFFILDEAEHPRQIKDRLRELNFETMFDSIELSNSQMALRWPLDISVNDTGKIIYIAPPVQENDPIKQRFNLCIRKGNSGHRVCTFKPKGVEFDTHSLVNELRADTGLIQRPSPINDYVTIDPEEVKITGIKENNGWIYINLNGGDSWGYFFNPDSPDTVFNFKDEPKFRLLDLDPALHAQYHESQPAGGADLKLGLNGTIALSKSIGFRDPIFDRYWAVKYNPDTNEVTSCNVIGSKDRINDFLVTNGEEKLKNIPDWAIEFHPPTLEQIKPKERWCNQFAPSKYLASTETCTKIPPTFERLIKHICVDKETYDYFINWVAYIVQTRKKTGTAWLFHGTTGTGKGSLFKRFFLPVFGHDHAFMGTTRIVTEEKNQFMERNIICVADEFKIKNDNLSSQMLATLRTYITEDNITIRAMRSNGVMRPSFANFLFFSNENIPMKIEDDDRRMNIAPRQDEPLEGANTDAFHQKLTKELDQTVQYLRQIKVNTEHVITPLDNHARALLTRNSKSSHDEFWAALNNGDLDFFTNLFLDDPDPVQLMHYNQYFDIISKWVDHKDSKIYVTKEEILKVYTWVTQTWPAPGLQKFTKLCQLNGIEFTRIKNIKGSDTRRQCIHIQWTGTNIGLIDLDVPDLSNVVNIDSK
jgi:hypothetical protein